MEVFLMYCIPCIPVGLFLALLIMSGIKKKLPRIVGTLLLAAALTALFAGGFTLEDYGDRREWNGGQCPYCGGKYEFVNASRYRNNTTYYYECDNCGDIIETGRSMK